jgi:integrase
MGKLTAVQVKHASQGRHGDGRGLYLRVEGGSKAWVLRYEHQKRERWMGLGSVEFVTVAQARERAFELRRQLKHDKIDPLEARKALQVGARLAALSGSTFEQVARQYVEVRATAKKWRGDGSRREWLSSLERYAFPKIGSLPVHLIDSACVHSVLDPVWIGAKKPHVGARLRERLELILEFAKARNLRQGENPAEWRRLKHSYAGIEVSTRNHVALPFDEVPAFMQALRELRGIAARALEFLILTASRTGEARFARWSEIDFAARVWTIPGERMKGGKEHRVPLSDRALAILRELPRGGGAVFGGRSNGGFMNQDAMADVLAKLRSRETATVHGFRSTFRDWAAERTGYPNHVVEMALAHAISNGVEAAYRRGDLFEKRSRLMSEWAAFCASPGAGDVVAFRGSGHG